MDNNLIEPKHYRQGKYECFDEMRVIFGEEAIKSFCKCNIYKYKYRANMKGGQIDLDKADFYIDYLIKLENHKI